MAPPPRFIIHVPVPNRTTCTLSNARAIPQGGEFRSARIRGWFEIKKGVELPCTQHGSCGGFLKEQARFFGHRWVIPIDNANVVAWIEWWGLGHVWRRGLVQRGCIVVVVYHAGVWTNVEQICYFCLNYCCCCWPHTKNLDFSSHQNLCFNDPQFSEQSSVLSGRCLEPYKKPKERPPPIQQWSTR